MRELFWVALLAGAAALAWFLWLSPGPTVTFVLKADMPEELSARAWADTLHQTVRVLDRRLRSQGLTGASVVPESGDRIRVTVPARTELTRVRALLVLPGRLTFARVLRAGASPSDPLRAGAGERLLADREAVLYVVADEPLLTGAALARAELVGPETGGYALELQFTQPGAQAFARAVLSLPEGERIAIAVDGVVQSAPVVHASLRESVRDEPPREVRVDGGFTRVEAELLVATLNAGELPVGLTLVSESGAE